MLQKPSKKNILPLDMMSLERMGCRYPSRLSFSRSMLRRMIKENWCVNRVRFELDKEGYGFAIYEVKTPKQLYSLICFSQYIDESELKEFLDEHENYFSELISEYIKKLKAISSS